MKQLALMFKNFKEDLDYIKETINEDSEFGRLCKYLLTTERNPFSIIINGYSQEHADSVADLFHMLYHGLYDDGEVTFYTVNTKPMISLTYEPTREDLLGGQLVELEKRFSKYKLEYLTKDIDNWIKLSEEYHENDIRRCFLSDYKNDKSIINYYRKYSCFKEEWKELEYRIYR